MNRPGIWHLSGDFPDPFDTAKTQAIRRLIDLTATQFEHRVFSINRVTPGTAELAHSLVSGAVAIEERKFEYGVALRYQAPPRGLFHATYLKRLGDWLADQAEAYGKPDLIIGHKLTIEGIAVERAARKLGVPYAIVIQGNSDEKILRYRPGLHTRLERVFHRAGAIFPFAPWALAAAEEKLGKARAPVELLPCPLAEGWQLVAPTPGGSQFASAFNLGTYKEKNLAGLARALGLLRARGVDVHCRIAGGGKEADRRATKRAIGNATGIEFLGQRDQPALARLFNESIAMVLPSRRESFGLVFIEALMSGCPIIYPAGAGVDGYFNGKSFALRVDATDPRSIADAMEHATANQAEMKAALAEWQQSDEARFFARASIAEIFAAGIRQAIEPS
ncbi:glycosyltransferase [Altererythrobacter sp.]|uniref:glycosyltransferase n=1 Tax=Altererythrobacter sp. TaxID=1872480 RepID=UPI003CFD8B77